MKQLKVAIVTDDRAYGEALARALRYRSRSFRISLHSSPEFIERWKEGGIAYRKSHDLVLWDGIAGERIKGDNIIWISDMSAETGTSRSDRRKSHIVYRYDVASSIHSRIMDVYSSMNAAEAADGDESRDAAGNHGSGTGCSRIIAFGSWQGGSGCTTLCRAVARELTRFFAKNVLWISLDGIEPEAERHPYGENAGRGVDRFLYRVLNGEENAVPVEAADIEGFIARDGYGVMSLFPSMGRNPLPHLGAGEAEAMMAALIKGDLFDAILIDSGSCCSEAAAGFMGSVDRLCLIGRGGDEGKKRRYMTWIGNAIPEMSEDRIVTIDRIEDMGRADDETLPEGDYGKNIHVLSEALWYNKIDTSKQ